MNLTPPAQIRLFVFQSSDERVKHVSADSTIAGVQDDVRCQRLKKFAGRPWKRILARSAQWLAALFFSVGCVVSAATDNNANEIIAARFVDPVNRYGHFAPGRPHEYARIEASLAAGARLVYILPQSQVFEDVHPRLVRLAKGGPVTLLAVVSEVNQGAALVLFGVKNGQLTVLARSAPIGTAMRWLNPVAAADLDGDGIVEIAAIITPHLSGTLKIFRQAGDELVEVAALGGFSNHVYGSAELGLSALVITNGRTRLLIPDQSRTVLRLIEYAGGNLRESGHCLLGAPVTGAITNLGNGTVEIAQQQERQRLILANCVK